MRLAGFNTRALVLDGSGPTFVLLHGFADSADTWREVLTRLRDEGRAAVALDLPGFATADPMVEYEGVLDQLADFAAAAVEHYGDCVLVGNSLGGTAALVCEAEVPLVAIAPAGFDMGGWIYRLEGFWLLQALLRAPLPSAALRPAVGQIFRQLAIHDQRAVPAELVARFASHHVNRGVVAGYLAIARRLLPELNAPLPITRSAAPALVIWGREDRMLPVASHARLLERVPHARVELIDGCGHCPQLECPQRTTELLVNFA